MVAGRAGLWMIAFELLERLWKLCVGVCEYAIGRGQVGEDRIDEDEEYGEGEEDGRLLGDADEEVVNADEDEDESVRKGRLILRQFQHNSYHLHARLKTATKGMRGETLTEAQLRELCGTKWSVFGGGLSQTAEGIWWNNLSRVWGLTKSTGEDNVP